MTHKLKKIGRQTGFRAEIKIRRNNRTVARNFSEMTVNMRNDQIRN